MGVRAEAKEQTRALILACARKLFIEQGYAAVGIREICEAANRSTGSLFSHFKGKAQVFEAAMERPAPEVQAFLEKIKGIMPIGYEQPHRVLDDLAKEAEQLLVDLYGLK